MQFVELRPKYVPRPGQQPPPNTPIPKFAEQPDPTKPEEFNKPLDLSAGKKKPWYWKPNEKDLNASIESLGWIATQIDPETEKQMTEAQYRKSYKNFQLWYMTIIELFVEEHREKEHAELFS